MLAQPELDHMRATAAAALPGTAIIQTQSWVSDGGGGGTTGWAAAGTVACRVAPVLSVGTGEIREGDRIVPDADSIITLPFDAEVDEGSRLVIDGTTYEVDSIRDRSWNVTTRVEGRRLV